MKKRIATLIALSVILVAISATPLSAVDVHVSAGIDSDYDLDQNDARNWLFLGGGLDSSWVLSRVLFLDSNAHLRIDYLTPDEVKTATAAMLTGMTFRRDRYFARVAVDTIGRITDDGSDDFFLADLSTRFEYGSIRYSLFVEPGVEREWGDNAMIGRRIKGGFSRVLGDRAVGEIAALAGDDRDDLRKQWYYGARTELEWYPALPRPVAFRVEAGVERYRSDDELVFSGEGVPFWSYNQYQMSLGSSIRSSSQTRLTLGVPLTMRVYDHNALQEDDTLSGETQWSLQMEPRARFSVRPFDDRLELSARFGADLTRSNSPILEQNFLVGGISVYYAF
ncbi:MAG: hypothetical protein LC641_00545 [Spirochaeta sp.]|nr:hypothetical protein [Spirochaeta sp.]